MLDCALGQQSN